MRFCCWECGWCWCWRERDIDFSVKPGVGDGGGSDRDTEEQWAKKFLGFRNTLKQWFEFDRQTSLGDDDLMFSLLLALYSTELISRDTIEGIEEESLIANEMQAIYARDPSIIEFYLPQLCTYLASNGFDSDESPRVMSFLLEDVCRRDLRLAHRVMWHINAFCSPITSHAAQSMKKCVEREGAISARAIEPKLGIDHPFNSYSSSMFQQLNHVNNGETVISHVEMDGYENTEAIGYQELFYSCMNFVEALTDLSAKLNGIEPSKREEYVRDTLDRINEGFLCRETTESRLVYIPFGNCFYRVIRIIPSESLLLTTKERVPLLLTLEVESFELNQLGIGNFGQVSMDNRFNNQFDAFRRKLIDGFTSLRERALLGRVQQDGPSSGGPGQLTHLSPSYIPSTPGYMTSPPHESYLGQWADPLPQIPVGEESSDMFGRPGMKKQMFSGNFHPLNSEDPLEMDSASDEKATAFIQEEEPGTRCGNENGKTRASPLLLTPHSHFTDGSGIICSHKKNSSSSSWLNSEGEDVSEPNEEKLDDMVCRTLNNGESDQEQIIFKERWSEKEARIWQQSVFAEDAVEPRHQQIRLHRSSDSGSSMLLNADLHRGDSNDQIRDGDIGGSWCLVPIIVKANDDLRQEQAVSQLIAVLARIWDAAQIGVWVHSYSILAISQTAGIIEAIPDTLSLHALKRHTGGVPLDKFFTCHFLKKKGGLRRARSNFVKSCAGYAIVCYLLQIKDRHNGNILLDAEGHLVHIDWGFVLGLSPGGNFGFENAPFKLTADMVSIMGGTHSFAYQKFRILCVRAFLEARRQKEKLILLVEMLAENGGLPCFSRYDPRTVVEALRDRFLPDNTPSECADIIYDMIATSQASWRTSIYDCFQKYASGVL